MKQLLPGLVTLVALAFAWEAWAQAPGVPVVREMHGVDPAVVEEVAALQAEGQLLTTRTVNRQLKRESCRLTLPPPEEQILSGRGLFERGRQAHVRVGHLYKCDRCSKWHLRLAGGYAITADGAIVTCYHVVVEKELKEAHLVAVTADGVAMPVREVLAADRKTDVAILRVDPPTPLRPLPLNVSVHPGDPAWCYSDPASHDGFFSTGIVNRFFRHTHPDRAPDTWPLSMNVSTDWAPGSSGAAVMDSAGNAIGHVSEIAAHAESGSEESGDGNAGETLIVFHRAVCAVDVLRLIEARE